MLSEVMLRTRLQDLANKKEPKTHSKPFGNPSTLIHNFAFSTWQSNRNPQNKKTSRNDHTTRATTFQENDNNNKKITVMAPGQAKRWTENFCRRQIRLRGTF